MLGRKRKAGVTVKIPGFGDRHIQTLLADYDGTLCCHGEIAQSIKERLERLAEVIDIHILTADRKAKGNEYFGRLPVKVHVLSEKDQDVQKRDYLIDFKTMNVVVFGNGNNDRLLLQAVKTGGGLCIAVQNGEGCAVDALINSHLLAANPAEAMDLLLNPDTLAATLRY